MIESRRAPRQACSPAQTPRVVRSALPHEFARGDEPLARAHRAVLHDADDAAHATAGSRAAVRHARRGSRTPRTAPRRCGPSHTAATTQRPPRTSAPGAPGRRAAVRFLPQRVGAERHEPAVLAVAHELLRAIDRMRDDRQSRRGRLERHERERLVSRREKRTRRTRLYQSCGACDAPGNVTCRSAPALAACARIAASSPRPRITRRVPARPAIAVIASRTPFRSQSPPTNSAMNSSSRQCRGARAARGAPPRRPQPAGRRLPSTPFGTTDDALARHA